MTETITQSTKSGVAWTFAPESTNLVSANTEDLILTMITISLGDGMKVMTLWLLPPTAAAVVELVARMLLLSVRALFDHMSCDPA